MVVTHNNSLPHFLEKGHHQPASPVFCHENNHATFGHLTIMQKTRNQWMVTKAPCTGGLIPFQCNLDTAFLSFHNLFHEVQALKFQ